MLGLSIRTPGRCFPSRLILLRISVDECFTSVLLSVVRRRFSHSAHLGGLTLPGIHSTQSRVTQNINPDSYRAVCSSSCKSSSPPFGFPSRWPTYQVFGAKSSPSVLILSEVFAEACFPPILPDLYDASWVPLGGSTGCGRKSNTAVELVVLVFRYRTHKKRSARRWPRPNAEWPP